MRPAVALRVLRRSFSDVRHFEMVPTNFLGTEVAWFVLGTPRRAAGGFGGAAFGEAVFCGTFLLPFGSFVGVPCCFLHFESKLLDAISEARLRAILPAVDVGRGRMFSGIDDLVEGRGR